VSVLDHMPQQAKHAADAGSWGVVIISLFTDLAPVFSGIDCMLAAIWSGLQIYSWAQKKYSKKKQKKNKTPQ